MTAGDAGPLAASATPSPGPGITAPPLDAAGERVKLTEFSIDAPDTLVAGPHVFTVDNTGGLDHGLSLIRFRRPAAPTGLTGHAIAASAPGDAVHEGGIMRLTPGGRAVFEADLDPGTYAFVCYLGDHFDKGMTRVFTVASGQRSSPAPLAPLGGEIVVDDRGVSVVGQLRAGPQALTMRNDGRFSWGLEIDWVPTPGTLVVLGGPSYLAPGRSEQILVELEPGTYLASPTHHLAGLYPGTPIRFTVGP